jgi:hypothetical protein
MMSLESAHRAPLVLLLGSITVLALCYAAFPTHGTRILLRVSTGECCRLGGGPSHGGDYDKLLDNNYASHGKEKPVSKNQLWSSYYGGEDQDSRRPTPNAPALAGMI